MLLPDAEKTPLNHPAPRAARSGTDRTPIVSRNHERRGLNGKVGPE